MTTIKLAPPRVPITDPRTGTVTREWYLFFIGLFDRVGGSVGLSTTDVDAGSFAAMQPAAFDGLFADLTQAVGATGDAGAEAFQSLQADSQSADVQQIDTTQPTQFWSP